MHDCRAGQVEEAVAYARSSLAPLRGILAHRNRTYDAQLRDIVALLAYEDPMVRVFGELLPVGLHGQGSRPHDAQLRSITVLVDACEGFMVTAPPSGVTDRIRAWAVVFQTSFG